MIKIYLACPYWDEDPLVREARFRQVNYAAGVLMRAGYVVFSPISHSHPISEETGWKPEYDWLEQDFQFLMWADEVWVLQLDGWAKSLGVGQELEWAEYAGKRIEFATMGRIDSIKDEPVTGEWKC